MVKLLSFYCTLITFRQVTLFSYFEKSIFRSTYLCLINFFCIVLVHITFNQVRTGDVFQFFHNSQVFLLCYKRLYLFQSFLKNFLVFLKKKTFRFLLLYYTFYKGFFTKDIKVIVFVRWRKRWYFRNYFHISTDPTGFCSK